MSLPAGFFQDSLALAQALFLSQAHGKSWELRLSWSLWEFYQGVLADQPVPLRPGAVWYQKDWAGPPFDQLQDRLPNRETRKSAQVSFGL